MTTPHARGVINISAALWCVYTSKYIPYIMQILHTSMLQCVKYNHELLYLTLPCGHCLVKQVHTVNMQHIHIACKHAILVTPLIHFTPISKVLTQLID